MIMEFLKTNNKTIYSGILIVLAICLLLGYVPSMSTFSSWVTPPVALFLGLVFALLCGQAYPKFNKKVSKKLLQYSVVGLGFGMNLHASLASGKEGMMFTIISVIGTMIIGMFIGRKMLKVNRDTSYLISSGTAICGGSAIAAIAPVIKAKDNDMTVALGTIFALMAQPGVSFLQQRFSLNNPCTVTGICGDCKSETCICNQILITRHCRPVGHIKFILVGEELGL